MAKRPAPSRGILSGNQPPPITDYIEVVNRLMTNIRQVWALPSHLVGKTEGELESIYHDSTLEENE